MKITTTTGLIGFLLALSTLNVPEASATVTPEPETTQTIDARLAAITEALKTKTQFATSESLLSLPAGMAEEMMMAAIGWGNGRGGVAWGNSGNGFRNGGWGNGGFRNGGWGNGGFRNNGWGNGWRDGGGFINFR